jgi:hypothetical protein
MLIGLENNDCSPSLSSLPVVSCLQTRMHMGVRLQIVPASQESSVPSSSTNTLLSRSSTVLCLCVQRLSSFTLELNKDWTLNCRLEHKYTLIILFHPRTISLCHDVCDTLMSRFSALACITGAQVRVCGPCCCPGDPRRVLTAPGQMGHPQSPTVHPLGAQEEWARSG